MCTCETHKALNGPKSEVRENMRKHAIECKPMRVRPCDAMCARLAHARREDMSDER